MVKKLKPSRIQRVTDFFPRRDGPSSSQPSSAPKPAATASKSGANKSKNNAPRRPDQEVISISSTSHISISSDSVTSIPPPKPKPKLRSRSFMDAVEIPSPPRLRSRMPPPTAATSSSLKRPHSPDIQFAGASQRANKPSLTKRKKVIFDDDNEDDVVALPAIYVNRPSNITKPQPQQQFIARTPISINSTPLQSCGPLTPKENTIAHRRPIAAKKAPLSPLQAESDVEGQVPSSQSDEQELAMLRIAKRDPQEVKEAVDKWRAGAVGTPGTTIPVWDMDMDTGVGVDEAHDDGFDPIPDIANSPSTSEAEISAHLRSTSAIASSTRSPPATVPSPPHSPNGQHSTALTQPTLSNTPRSPLQKVPSQSSVPVPTTPVALSPKSKTAQIVAQIKANAYAATLSSPDESGPNFDDFKDELDESSDEDDMDLFAGKGAYRAKPTALPNRPTRGSLRGRHISSPSPSQSRSRSRSATVSSHNPNKRVRIASSNRRPAVLTKAAVPKAKPTKRNTSDPLDMLLREKKLADKKGNGANALRVAEDAMTNERAAFEAVKESARVGWDSESPRGSVERDEDEYGDEGNPEGGESGILDEKSRERLLGSERGKVVGDILVKDKEKGKMGGVEKNSGVPFWESGVEIQLEKSEKGDALVIGTDDAYPMLGLFKEAVGRGDLVQAKLLLNSGIFANLPSAQAALIFSWLFSQALSPRETPLSLSCFHALSHLANAKGVVSSPLLLSALLQLGARRTVFESLHSTVGAEVKNAGVDVQRREDVLYRLVKILSVAARTGGLVDEDVADILLSLLLIAIDPTTSSELQGELIIAIDTICQSLGQCADVIAVKEATICTKLLKFACELAPINKAMFVSFLSGGGSGRTKRIAIYVAHGLLTGRTDVSADKYTTLPSLHSILSVLSPKAGSHALFDFQSNSTTTDYEDLRYYVDILGIVLSDIDSYVAEEMLTPHLLSDVASDLSRPGSPRKNSDKPLTMLEMVKNLLEVIHGKIVDTRAAHLDRSRTKAALQRLSMRIYYQRLAALKFSAAGKRKPKNLDAYFRS